MSFSVVTELQGTALEWASHQVPESLVARNSGESPTEAPRRLLSASPWGLWWGLEAAWGEELAGPRPVERGLRGVVRPPGSVPEPRLLLQVPSCVLGDRCSFPRDHRVLSWRTHRESTPHQIPKHAQG